MVWHPMAGGLPSDVDSSLHLARSRDTDSTNSRGFYLTALQTRWTTLGGEVRGVLAEVTEVTHDTWVHVKTSKFARTWTRLLPGARDLARHRENTDMARHTRIKFA